MDQINISINPWYFCNFRCNFCYLTEDQLSDTLLLSMTQLDSMLKDISTHRDIGTVDLYGGELGLLPKPYWNALIDVLTSYDINDINLTTNLSMMNDITLDERVYTTVSYDFEARESSDKVWSNMCKMSRPFSILILASPAVMATDVDYMISALNVLSNLQSVEIKPYSSNQANVLAVTYTQHEEFVKKWITHPTKHFDLVNTYLLDDVINKTRRSFSDDHVYITPRGKYGVLEFDASDREYFLEYDTFDEYIQWCAIEACRVAENKICSKCDYYGHCLSEHLRDVKSLDGGCNGFVHLIQWHANRTTI